MFNLQQFDTKARLMDIHRGKFFFMYFHRNSSQVNQNIFANTESEKTTDEKQAIIEQKN